MVKPAWLGVAFLAGIAVGVLVTQMAADAPVGEPATVNTDTPATPRDAAAATPPLPALPDAVRPPAPAGHTTANAAPPSTSTPVDMPAETATADAGPVQAIDAGDVFNKMFAKPAQPGTASDIGEAHRALERETRDEGWAYSMEAEIQNSMVNEVSMGAFRADHVECRSTMCELRLSGKGDQAAAIKRWTEELGGQPFGQRLFLNYSSSISDDNRVDTLMIFRRPPKQK